MLKGYIPIFFILFIALIAPILVLLFARLLYNVKKTEVKGDVYECGIKPEVGARDRYSVRYYIIALLFLVFDVETIFLFPWAVMYKKLALFGLIEMAIFIVILVIGYVYAWKKKALEWV